MKPIAVDTNTFVQMSGLYNKIQTFIRSNPNYKGKLEVRMFYRDAAKTQANALEHEMFLISQAIKGKLQLVLLPTVIMELQVENDEDCKKELYDNYCRFIKGTNVQVIKFSQEKRKIRSHLVDIYAHKNIDPKTSSKYKFEKAFNIDKERKNADHDARIMAEASILGCDILTQDKHFSNSQLIYKHNQIFLDDLIKRNKFEILNNISRDFLLVSTYTPYTYLIKIEGRSRSF